MASARSSKSFLKHPPPSSSSLPPSHTFLFPLPLFVFVRRACVSGHGRRQTAQLRRHLLICFAQRLFFLLGFCSCSVLVWCERLTLCCFLCNQPMQTIKCVVLGNAKKTALCVTFANGSFPKCVVSSFFQPTSPQSPFSPLCSVCMQQRIRPNGLWRILRECCG